MGDGVWAGGSSTGETLETHRHAALSSSEKGEGKCVRVTRREQQERGRERRKRNAGRQEEEGKAKGRERVGKRNREKGEKAGSMNKNGDEPREWLKMEKIKWKV